MQPDTRLPHARVTGQLDQGSELSRGMPRLTQEDLRRGLTAAIHDRPISDSHMTDPEASSSSVVRFDVFEVDLQAGELRRDSRKIKLQEQPFRVLSSVLERPGELVTRKELCQKLWPADTFVDFDHGLNSAVARLRDALSDSAEQPKFIETVPKRGYRFIASLIHHPVPVLPSSENFPPTRLQNFIASKIWVAIGAAVFMLMLVSAIVLARSYSKMPPTAEAGISSQKPARPSVPAYSPDGKQVAFRQNEGRDNDGIFTALVGGENPTRLTSHPGDFGPAWSPDSRQIAFIRYSDNSLSINIVPAFGGVEREVYTMPAALSEGLTWSKTGKAVAFTESTIVNPRRSWIVMCSLPDSMTRRLTSPPDGYRDTEAVFSPDGSRIAFLRSEISGSANNVFVVPVAGGEARQLTFHDQPIIGPPAWSRDGREIVVSSTGSPASL
jgi:DNA-binding winged helix-turn-helix (wHTH) protein